jgi:hypothetical protein
LPNTSSPSGCRFASRRRAAENVAPAVGARPRWGSQTAARRSGTWSPAALELPNDRADGVAPGARPRGESSGEFIRDGNISVRR